MPALLRPFLALGTVVLLLTPARAHYNMLLPERHTVKREEPVTVLYQWGHPFEHQLFDAPAPQRLLVLAPDGTATELTKRLEKVTVVTADAKQVAAYRLRFVPEQRGDYLFLLQSAPIWMAEEQCFLQDTVKVVLHVQGQRGWDALAKVPFQLTPLTRPYGLQPGMAFQAEVVQTTKPGDRLLVEIEHYNASPPAQLPADEQITRTAKTDPNGVVTCTLTEPGWWCLTAMREGGKLPHEGKEYPVQQRATFWVHVDGQPGAAPGK